MPEETCAVCGEQIVDGRVSYVDAYGEHVVLHERCLELRKVQLLDAALWAQARHYRNMEEQDRQRARERATPIILTQRDPQQLESRHAV